MEILKIAPSRQKCRFPPYPSPNPDNAYQHSSRCPPRVRIPEINFSGSPANVLAKPAVYSPYRPQKTGKFSYSQVLCGKDVDKLRKSGGFFSSVGSDLRARMNLAPTRDCRSSGEGSADRTRLSPCPRSGISHEFQVDCVYQAAVVTFFRRGEPTRSPFVGIIPLSRMIPGRHIGRSQLFTFASVLRSDFVGASTDASGRRVISRAGANLAPTMGQERSRPAVFP